MSTNRRLAAALAAIISERLERADFVWLPELVTPLPVDELLAVVLEQPSVRAGVFVDGFEPSDDKASADVRTVIDWRNDASIRDKIVVIGSLERDRASGLGSIRPIGLRDVRRRLFGTVVAELRTEGVPHPAIRLLQQLGEFEALVDLEACSR